LREITRFSFQRPEIADRETMLGLVHGCEGLDRISITTSSTSTISVPALSHVPAGPRLDPMHRVYKLDSKHSEDIVRVSSLFEKLSGRKAKIELKLGDLQETAANIAETTCDFGGAPRRPSKRAFRASLNGSKKTLTALKIRRGVCCWRFTQSASAA